MSAILDFASARAARGLPACPAPPPGKRVGDRVRVKGTAIAGTVTGWAPAPGGARTLLMVQSALGRAILAEDAVEPAGAAP